jgi:hypothetical protein
MLGFAYFLALEMWLRSLINLKVKHIGWVNSFCILLRTFNCLSDIRR